MDIDTAQISGWVGKAIDFAILHGPPLIIAIVLLVVGLKVIKKIEIIVAKALRLAKINESLVPFLSSMAAIGLKILLFMTIAGIVGIDIAAFVGILAAATFAIGLALQGSLANFAAGIVILIFKPYKTGDWIEVNDKFGKVEEIQIFNTIMVTPGKKTLIIPNGQVVDNIVTNFSEKGQVRLELNVTMPYGEDFPKVQSIIMNVLDNTPGVLPMPKPSVGIETFDSHSIVLTVRPFVLPDDYWDVTFEVNQRIKAAFHENKVQVAYSEGVELGIIGG